jgi:hypothetical protein
VLHHRKVLPISPEPTTADSGYALVDNN